MPTKDENWLAFTKMHGTGNDFMVIDNTAGAISFDRSQIAAWADRHFGIGFDQLLVVQSPSVAEAEFDYRIFNADGGEVEHCGNGARCFARFVTERGLTGSSRIPVNTSAGLLTLSVNKDQTVTVLMGVPEFEPSLVPFNAPHTAVSYPVDLGELPAAKSSLADIARCGIDNPVTVMAVAIGNPHAVVMVDDVDTAPVQELGVLLESHPRFPKRVNVGFMQIVDRSHIRLRVFERGVGETRACGTGACAAVALGIRGQLLDASVRVQLSGGELSVHWSGEGENIEMTGPCTTVFEGQIRM